MTYNKPKGKRYVDLAIEFDNEFYSGNRNDTKLFSYMYLLFYMLACKKKYFHSFEEYDDYANFAATVIYLRFINKEKQGEKIKSVLNYCKSTLYSLKVMWQNATFNEILANDDTRDVADGVKDNMKASIQEDYNEGMVDDIFDKFKALSYIIKQVINETPYRKNKLYCRKLYLSCALSLINYFTISKNTRVKIEANEAKADKVMIAAIANNKNDYIILWHLDNSQRDYIQTLVNKTKSKLSNEIEDIRHSYILETDVLESIINSTYDEFLGLDDEEGNTNDEK